MSNELHYLSIDELQQAHREACQAEDYESADMYAIELEKRVWQRIQLGQAMISCVA